jgi:multidrug efflux system outer membrane protein
MDNVKRALRGARRRGTAAALGGLLVLSAAGCAVGPKYRPPDVPGPPQFKERPPATGGDSGAPAIAYADWWRVFNDPALDDLERQAVTANLDIRVAVARVDQAAAGARYAGSFLFPTVSLGAAASGNREAQNRPNTNGRAAAYNDFQLPLILSYEVDAWGRVRRSLESAHAVEQATEADLRFVQLSIQTGLAVDYYSLRQNDAEQQVLQQTLEELQRAVDLTTQRFRGGVTSELEVKQAQGLLDQTRAQAQALDIQRAELEHAIAVLIGRAASEFALPRAPFDGAPPEVPAGIPADLLVRRPDIAEADRFAASAAAAVGVAKAAYLPQISLTGLAGFESTAASSLFTWANAIASLGASALTPVFNRGRVRAGVDEAAAAYRQSLAQYQKTVLVAYQEVEDQLAGLRFLQGEGASETAAIDAARQALQIALDRYQGGLVSYLDVVFAQTTLLANQRVSAQISGQRMTATVMLIKALGGGWLQLPSGSTRIPSMSQGPS